MADQETVPATATVYNYDADTGAYLYASQAPHSPMDEPGTYLVPAHATMVEPPQVAVGQVAVFRSGAWATAQDHTGQTFYTADGTPVKILLPGVNPDPSWAATPPPPTPEQVAATIKSGAMAALTKSDVTVLRCLEEGKPVPVTWTTYRAALRAIIAAPSSVMVLPALPDYP